MGVDQLRELREDLHHLIRTLTAGRDDHDVGFSLLRDRMLQHRLSCTEGTRDKACTTLNDGVHRINRADTCLQQLEGAGFLTVAGDRPLHRPLLHHGHLHLRTIRIGQDSHRVINGICALSSHLFHGVGALERKGYHDLMRLGILIHLT